MNTTSTQQLTGSPVHHMITLYELRWSHYCEKIRLVLDYMQLPWQAVSINPFSKKQLRAHALAPQLPNYTVPAIFDAQSEQFVMDSTPILRYLAAQYADAPALFPGNAANQQAIDAQLLEFDTVLGLAARRLGDTQVMLESPATLSDLFLGGGWTKPVIRTLAGHAMGMMLCKRFGMHRTERDGLYEALEQYLLALAQRVEGKPFIVGDALSAADLAFAAQLRPLTIIPFFAEHPQLQGLFERHRRLLAQYSREGDSAYQVAIAKARAGKSPVRRKIKPVSQEFSFARFSQFAANDQKPVWDWRAVAMPFQYLFGLRQGKVRQALAAGDVR